MDIAIKYEKINLGGEKYIFKPISIITGLYDEETELFETNYKELCAPIDGNLKEERSYYGNCISKDVLLASYEGLDEGEILEEYFNECCDVFTIAYYDDALEYKFQVLDIPFETVQKYFLDNQEHFYLDKQTIKQSCSLDFIKYLRNIDNLDEIYDRLDDIITASYRAQNELKKLDKINFNQTINEQYDGNAENNFHNNSDDEDIEAEEEYIDEFMNTEEESSKKITAETSLLLKKEESKLITLKELRKEVKDVIKGQDKAVDDVTRTILINEMSKNPRHKSHILIMGPSGTGKTEMINIISKRLDIPYFKADATAYTKEGYVGKSVYSMIGGLINAAEGDVEKAQKGILIIDEIDKKLTSEEDWVGGVEVFNSLLKVMDRDVIEIDVEGMGKKKILFDTSNLTIIFMGAFAKLYEQKTQKTEDKKTIGFMSSSEPSSKKEKLSLTNDDLIKAGMPPEFLGRISVITNTQELEIEDLVEILYKSKGGAIDEEVEFCEGLGIQLKFTNPYMREIAKKAKETKTGARTLRKLVRESLADAYDEILSGKKIKVLKLTKETANNPKKYYTE